MGSVEPKLQMGRREGLCLPKPGCRGRRSQPPRQGCANSLRLLKNARSRPHACAYDLQLKCILIKELGTEGRNLTSFLVTH